MGSLIAGGLLTGLFGLVQSNQATQAEVQKSNVEYVRSVGPALDKFAADEADISHQLDLIAQLYRRNSPKGQGQVAAPTETLEYAPGAKYSSEFSKASMDELTQLVSKYQDQLLTLRQDIGEVSLKDAELKKDADPVGEFYEQAGREYEEITPGGQAKYLGKSITSDAMAKFDQTVQRLLNG